MKIEFEKMSGAGNDFIVIDNRSALIQDAAGLARKVCDRHWGIGADGLLLLEKSSVARYRMKYYNADGSDGGMCGNGGRCIALFAFSKGIGSKAHEFEALKHIYSASIEDDIVSLKMKNPSNIVLNQHIVLKRKQIIFSSIDSGSPHIVVDIDQFTSQHLKLQTFDVQFWGRALRENKKFAPQGTNVNFIHHSKDGKIYLRTYERGVEAETLACGTGSIASAIIASLQWNIKPPITIIPLSKIPLTIDFKSADRRIDTVSLTGPAKTIFIGTMNA